MPVTELGWESEAHYQARKSKARSTRSDNTGRGSSRSEIIEDILLSEGQQAPSTQDSRQSTTASSRKPSPGEV
ncbi:hypothetical protein IAR50_006645 [Cryptococcus sp. DSM 104548]